MISNYRFFLALSLLGVGCSGSSSLGSDHTDSKAGMGGSNAPGVGGTTVGAGAGGASTGGSKATAGAGGTMTGTVGSGAASAAGQGGSGGTPMPGAGMGGSGAATPGAGAGGTGAAAGTAGTDMGQGGEGPNVTEPKTVDDPDAPGPGPCDGKSANDVLEAIHEQEPELRIGTFYDPNRIGQSAIVYGFTTEAGFRLVLAAGEGDCPAGCIDWEYSYFETDDTCTPQRVGNYSSTFGPGNCYTVVGEPMWGIPSSSPAGTSRCAPADINTTCVDSTCSEGLEPITYFDVAGEERCICSISCADDPNVCPEGTSCVGGADGPQDICYDDLTR